MFAMRLALVLGRVDVDGMLDSIDERQFCEWIAYDRIQPFGDERNDLRSGLGFSALCNAWGGKTKVEHFMPFTDYNETEIDAKREIDKARQIALRLGASKLQP